MKQDFLISCHLNHPSLSVAKVRKPDMLLSPFSFLTLLSFSYLYCEHFFIFSRNMYFFLLKKIYPCLLR